MEESVRQNVSIALYRYMCHTIIGTEKHVKTIRMMNNVKDNLQSNSSCTLITSGSYGEGRIMRDSDLDIMQVCNFAEVCEDTHMYFKPDTTYFEMEAEDTQPCFLRLRLRYFTGRSSFDDFLEKIGEGYYLSSAKFKQQLKDILLSTIHGPCISDKDGLCDLAYCLRSTSWISQAKQWIKRSNNSWPSYDIKQSIMQHGVLFVPMGVKGSIKEELEWRISFSVAEKLLIYTFTHTQLLCYALLKILIKDVIAKDSTCKELLCSYFLKTVILWISEELPPPIWKPNNLISCFMRCFRRLIYCVEYSMCPHYFIPENNLFENKMMGREREILLNTLFILNSFGWQCILFSNQILNFREFTSRIYKEPSCLHVDIRKLLFSTIAYLAYHCPPNKFDFLKGMHILLSLKSSKIKGLYSHFMSRFCCYSVQVLPFNLISDNKSSYKQHKTRLSILLQNKHHDVVSGWLMLATLFYGIKQYYIALDILQYSLFKCSPEKLYQGVTVSNTQHELFNLDVFKNMTIAQLCKFMLLNVIDLVSIKPQEIPFEGEGRIYSFPPLVYTHFLLFLCHYHLKNTSKYLDSLRDLQITIEGNYFIGHAYEKYVSYNILGLSFQLSGDKESARRAFKQGLEFKPKNRCG